MGDFVPEFLRSPGAEVALDSQEGQNGLATRSAEVEEDADAE